MVATWGCAGFKGRSRTSNLAQGILFSIWSTVRSLAQGIIFDNAGLGEMVMLSADKGTQCTRVIFYNTYRGKSIVIFTQRIQFISEGFSL